MPAVSTTALAWKVTPNCVFTPVTCLYVFTPDELSSFVVLSSTSNSFTASCHIFRFSMPSSISRHAQIYFPRSHCALGLHMAGPLERFSIRNWMAVLSATTPIYPPSASISRTICPLAMPPTAGLQLICPILFMSIVMRHVFDPILAAAAAASHPAWPAPMTMTSYLNSIAFFFFNRQKYNKPKGKARFFLFFHHSTT